MKNRSIILVSWMWLLFVISGATQAVDRISPELSANLDKYTRLMTGWAANPTVVELVKSSNSSGGLISGMTNSKWNFLEENDPLVLILKQNKAAELIQQWEAMNQAEISKLYLRDQKGNLVASSKIKPLVYNNKTKPPFENAIKGKPWTASEIKPDPGTQVPGVHVSVPVFDGDHVIGVLHSSVIAR